MFYYKIEFTYISYKKNKVEIKHICQRKRKKKTLQDYPWQQSVWKSSFQYCLYQRQQLVYLSLGVLVYSNTWKSTLVKENIHAPELSETTCYIPEILKYNMQGNDFLFFLHTRE